MQLAIFDRQPAIRKLTINYEPLTNNLLKKNVF